MTKAVGHFNMTTHRRRLFRYSLLTVWLPPDSIVFCPCSFDSLSMVLSLPRSTLPVPVLHLCLSACLSRISLHLSAFLHVSALLSIGSRSHSQSCFEENSKAKVGQICDKTRSENLPAKNPKTAPLEGKLIWWVCEQALFTSESSKFTRGYEDQILCSRIVTWKISTKWKVGTKFSSQPREYA